MVENKGSVEGCIWDTKTYENQYTISRNLNCDWSVIIFAAAAGADIPLLGI